MSDHHALASTMRAQDAADRNCPICGARKKRADSRTCSPRCRAELESARRRALFDARTEPSDNGCILWRGYTDKNGYGKFGNWWAHRFAYESVNGSVPKGMHLDHLCRTRACVNPEHLEVVAPRTNFHRGRKTKLTDEQVVACMAERAAGAGVRELARKYGINNGAMSKILSGKERSYLGVRPCGTTRRGR